VNALPPQRPRGERAGEELSITDDVVASAYERLRG
jgi:hypothetical protein